MSTSITRPRTETKPKTERPKVYKVILLNDDYTPREFVVTVLRAVFRMTTDQAHGVMLTAHMRGLLRGRGLHPRDRRDQGDPGDRHGRARGLSADVHHRAGGLSGGGRGSARRLAAADVDGAAGVEHGHPQVAALEHRAGGARGRRPGRGR